MKNKTESLIFKYVEYICKLIRTKICMLHTYLIKIWRNFKKYTEKNDVTNKIGLKH